MIFVDAGGVTGMVCVNETGLFDMQNISLIQNSTMNKLLTDPLCCISSVTCSDGTQNNDETDIDCGGSCPKCADGKSCSIGNDCESSYCNPSTKKCECIDECATSGAVRCSADIAQTCGNYDVDSCLEWGERIECGHSCCAERGWCCLPPIPILRSDLTILSLVIQDSVVKLSQIIVPSYSILSYWMFNENSGNDAEDSVSSNDLTGKAVWTKGTVNNALNCDTTSYMQQASNFNLDFSSKKEGSVSVWLRFNSTVHAGTYVLTIQNETTRLLELVQSGHGNFQAVIYENTWDKFIVLEYPLSSFNAGEWYLITLTWNEREARLWVNDKLIDTKQMSINYKPRADRIGVCRDYNAERYFHGFVDELATFDKALSELGIKKNYINGLAGKEYEIAQTSETVYNLVSKEVTFAFKIKNEGEKDANNVFWSLDTGVGSKKNSVGLKIKKGEETLVFTKYEYKDAGKYSVKVIVDPENRISELNEQNNEKSIVIAIASGDVNCDSQLDLGDVVLLLNHLFDNQKIDCPDNADFNSDGQVDIGDAIDMLDYLF